MPVCSVDAGVWVCVGVWVGVGISTFANEYCIRIRHFIINTYLSIDTFDNPINKCGVRHYNL